MKKFLLFFMMIFLTGCTAQYNLEFSNNTYKENFIVSGNNSEIIDGETFSKVINNYYNKNILVEYNAQPGDMLESDYPKYYEVYNKELINNGLKLSYIYNYDYQKSTLINELFYNIEINSNFINLTRIKDIFDKYPYLEDITISFKTDKIIESINSDESKDDIYYWYINKDNYNEKNINISFADSRIDLIAKTTKKNSDKFINVFIIIVIIIIMISIVVIYIRIKKTDK